MEQGTLLNLPMVQIEPPTLAVRSSMEKDKLQELANSIKSVGLIQPIAVFKDGKKYEIIAGHRRYLAFELLKEKMIPCIVKADKPLTNEIAKIAENAMREDVSAFDEANFITDVMKKYKINQKDLARKLKQSDGWVSQRLSILKYPKVLLEALKEGKITFSCAREFARIQDSITISSWIHYAVTGGCTPSTAKGWVDEYIRDRKVLEQEKGIVEVPKTNGQAQVLKLPCYQCEKNFKIEELYVIRICAGCREESEKA